MKRALTAAETRAVEELAASSHGVPIPVLMENAGVALAEAAVRLASPQGRFLVLCGAGNNGGDGLVAARKLREQGREVRVELVGDPAKRSHETTRNLAALQTVRLAPATLPADWAVAPGDVVVDALFGTGLSRAPAGDAAAAIERIRSWRSAGARVVSADLPSGLPSDGQAPFTPCVQADVTVTFGAVKLGQLSSAGAEACGRIELTAIGFPPVDVWGLPGSAVYLLEEGDARAAFPRRALDSNKGSFGHVLVLAGSPGKSGAATLCARAALRSGAGLCTLASRPQVLEPAMAATPELMGVPLAGGAALEPGEADAILAALEKKDAWVVGPGIPRGEATGELLAGILAVSQLPCVIDADGLNALAGRAEVLRHSAGPVILTPHPGEMARLLQTDVATVQADRLRSARALAETTQAVVVLKGARTVIAAPDGQRFVNPTGNPGMATGGTGDVLAGLCAGLLAQGIPSVEAACAAVYVHGLAGDLAAARRGQLGLIASDVIDGLSEVWTRWGR